MRWSGPLLVRDLLKAKDNGIKLPMVTKKGVYLVSKQKWNKAPTLSCKPLYVGGLTGKSKRLRTRIGDTIIDLLGFYGGSTGHSSGGKNLDSYCKINSVKRLSLWIGWATGMRCERCAEIKLYKFLKPTENKKRPPKCKKHNRAA